MCTSSKSGYNVAGDMQGYTDQVLIRVGRCAQDSSAAAGGPSFSVLLKMGMLTKSQCRQQLGVGR